MANSALQLCGFFLSLIGWILAIVTCSMPTWRKSDIQGEVIESVYRTTGLWVRCTHQTTGLWTCDDYDAFFLGLPVPLQAARATTCLSMVLGFLGVAICAMGLECTNIGSGDPRMKARMVLISGVLQVCSGIAIGVAVSWFAANVLQEYWNTLIVQNSKYVYGEALFVGWVSMALSVISGLVLCCSSWNSDDEDHGGRYTYNPPKPKASAAEYI